MVAKNGTATRNRKAETARASAVGEVGQEEVGSPLRGYVTPRAISDCRSNGALSLQLSQVTVSFTSAGQDVL